MDWPLIQRFPETTATSFQPLAMWLPISSTYLLSTTFFTLCSCRQVSPRINCGQAILSKKVLCKKKWPRKSLIPLPPTGFASFFCAKAGGDANDVSDQAGCGVCGLFGNCTVCKVLQRSAAALHNANGELNRGGILEATVYKGRALESRCFVGFSLSE